MSKFIASLLLTVGFSCMAQVHIQPIPEVPNPNVAQSNYLLDITVTGIANPHQVVAFYPGNKRVVASETGEFIVSKKDVPTEMLWPCSVDRMSVATSTHIVPLIGNLDGPGQTTTRVGAYKIIYDVGDMRVAKYAAFFDGRPTIANAVSAGGFCDCPECPDD